MEFTPEDWLNFTTALLCHDIGFARGICKLDKHCVVATGVSNNTIELPKGCSDSCLGPIHVDRGKMFVRDRLNEISELDIEKIQDYIESTRYPVPQENKVTDELAKLARAADYIGQLGDPNYLRKSPALFYEFVETGVDKKLGYKNPGDLKKNFAKFFWNEVHPHIKNAISLLNTTSNGRAWIAGLHAHVFDIEHEISQNCKG